jgi:hypothetical protein
MHTRRQHFGPIALVAIIGIGASAASAADFPKVKEGLWTSTTIRVPGQASMSSQICLNQDVLGQMIQVAAGATKLCTLLHEEHSGMRFTSQMQCNFGGKPTKSTSVTVFEGDSAFRSDISLSGAMEMTVHSQHRYAGACPADMAPGDLLMPGGIKVNVLHPPIPSPMPGPAPGEAK